MSVLHGLSINKDNKKLDVQLNDTYFERDQEGNIRLKLAPDGGLEVDSQATGLRVDPTKLIMADGNTLGQSQYDASKLGVLYNHTMSVYEDDKGKMGLGVEPTFLGRAIENKVAALLAQTGGEGEPSKIDELRDIVAYLTQDATTGAKMAADIAALKNPTSGISCGEDGRLGVDPGFGLHINIDGRLAVDPSALIGVDGGLILNAGSRITINTGLGLSKEANGTVAVKAGQGINVDNNGVSVKTIGSVLAYSNNSMYVNTKALAGNGLEGTDGTNGQISVKVGNGITCAGGSVAVMAGDGLTFKGQELTLKVSSDSLTFGGSLSDTLAVRVSRPYIEGVAPRYGGLRINADDQSDGTTSGLAIIGTDKFKFSQFGELDLNIPNVITALANVI